MIENGRITNLFGTIYIWVVSTTGYFLYPLFFQESIYALAHDHGFSGSAAELHF
jgi:hypothetical protein